MSNNRGVYFLANDYIFDFAVAFLNSFRTSNPDIPLCMIPFDNDIVQLGSLCSEYHFRIWQNDDILQQCDRISLSFHDHVLGHYRKLATWEGDFDEFIYIDSDTVVLKNVNFVYDYLKEFDFITSHSNIPEIRKWVWKDSIDEIRTLTSEQTSFAANTGFIASKRGCLDVNEVVRRLPAALELVDHMELMCCEQSFLNYLIVTSGMRYTSILTIARANESLNLPRELWAGSQINSVVNGGQLVCPERPPVLLVHWAGEWQSARKENRQVPFYELWSFYRRMRVDH